jgi:hypothetical protein
MEDHRLMNAGPGSPALPHMGDRISIALLKIYSPEDLNESNNANACLTAIRAAFGDRNRILGPSDKDPKVTMFVLDYLQQKKVSDHNFQKRIEYVRSCVKEFTCSPQGEYNFFKNN